MALLTITTTVAITIAMATTLATPDTGTRFSFAVGISPNAAFVALKVGADLGGTP